MRDVEPEGRAEGVLLVLGGEDALGDVASASGFGSGIPACPPVEREQDKETEEERRGGGRDEGEGIARLGGGGVGEVECVDLRGERTHATDGVDCEVREQADHRHLENELEQVGPEYGPEAGDGVVGEGEGETAKDSGELLPGRGEAQGESENLAHGQVYPAHDDRVDREGKVDGAKSAEEGGGRPG